MHGVDLNAVDAGLTQKLGGLAEGIDHLVDLLHGHGTGEHVLLPAVGSGGSGGAGEGDVDKGGGELAEQGMVVQLDHPGRDGHGTAEAGGQLDEELGPGLVELGHPLGELTEHGLVLIQPAAAHGIAHALHAGQDQAHAVLCALHQKVRGLLIEVAGLQPAKQRGAAHGTLDDAVFDFHIANLERSK